MSVILRSHQVRALDVMQKYDVGQIIVPTGGGKTFIMIQDTLRSLQSNPQTIVVVAPRILLAEQLCDEFLQQIDTKNVHICHVHSGETHHFSSTKSDKIALFNNTVRAAGESCIIFTTYHSLNRVVDSGIAVDCIYFDEAHNATGKHFHTSVFAVVQYAVRRYFFTATPRFAHSHDRGMNNSAVYGQVICNVRAQELIEQGSIVSPTVVPFDVDLQRNRVTAHESDCDTILGILDDLDDTINHKIVVAVPSSRVLGNMLGKTKLLAGLKERGYGVLHVTSKFGAYVNDKKVNREVFFNTMTEWGKEDSRKFVVFHYSILSEGINVPGLTQCVLLRNLDVVEMAQTIGRVIRMNKDDASDIASGKIPAGQCALYRKKTGIVTVPVFKNYGKQTIERLQRVVDAIFVQGIAPESFVR